MGQSVIGTIPPGGLGGAGAPPMCRPPFLPGKSEAKRSESKRSEAKRSEVKRSESESCYDLDEYWAAISP